MQKHSGFILMSILAAILVVGAAGAQEDMQVVDNDVFETPQRVKSIFQHDQHNEAAGIEECNTCHHIYEDGKLIEGESSEDQRCADCHGSRSSDGQPSLMSAYHRNCKGCHQERKSGPVMCGECHQWKSVVSDDSQ